ncbi:MAG TPA: L,D-transpeptidase family protein, partial [Hyphomicrobiales bacterium]|nr:L,D-transpeptidase family protein [Hyphomicrobiales bacterium]
MRNKGDVYCGVAALGIAGFAALAASTLYPADARPRSVEPNYQTRTPTNSPLLAVVALAEQHITVYDATGKILQAPVSTGATGYETPAGIYSIVQKEVDHHSNLYDDASMPYMERITWTGMALHAGVLPGYPASHGCVRMPHAFAEQLYGLTELGMRIVVVREDIAPAEIEQPFMFTARQRTAQGQGAAVNISARSIEADIRSRLQSAAASKLSEAETAIKREKELRLLAAKRSQEAAPAARALKLAEANFAQAEAALKAIEKAVAEADNPDKAAKLEPSKAQAESRFEKAKADLETAKQQAQAKMDAATQAEADAKAAAAAMGKAVEAAQMAKLNTSPVSVFISRKTQRLYIRKGNYPIFEEPVT